VRALISFAAALVAVVVQVTIVDRIAFPGGTGPDLVLLAVVALALASGPMVGVLTGFWAGLALDVAPPGSHFVGQNALVFCLVGYLCGLVADAPANEGVPEQGHTALFEIVVTAVGAVCGEALVALLGAMLSDPRVTWSAIRHVLPVAAAYDVLLCPFVLYAAAALLRLAGTPRGERDRAAWATPAAWSPAAATQGAIRQVSTGNTPRLRLADRGKGEGLGTGLRPGSRAPARREPRLKLGHGGALTASTLGTSTLGAAFANGGSRRGSGLSGGTMAGALGGGAKVKFAARRGQGTLGGSWGGFGGTSNLARSGWNSSRFGPSRMGRSLLGGSVFSHSSSALHPPPPPKKLASIGRSSFSGRSPFLSRSPGLSHGRTSSLRRTSVFGHRRTGVRIRSAPGGSATGYAPRAARPGLLARLAGALRGPARHQPRLRRRQAAFRQPLRTKSPGRGWLRRSSRGAGANLGSGTMRRRRRTPRLGAGPSRLHMPRPRSKRRWRTGGYR
jgi:rod shape-determining protein MreD